MYGYDIIDKGLGYSTTNWEEIPHEEIDVYIITVWTGVKDGEPDMSAVEDVARKISEHNSRALVSIESTIVPGLSRKLAESYGLDIAHCPHRYWGVDPVHYGVRQPRVLGAINNKTLKRAIRFYQSLDIPVFVVSSVEIAEMSKIVENAYRYLTIAFAEQVRMVAEAMGMPFWELRQAVNTKFNVDLPEAREGIGGHCLPKDVRYLEYIGKKIGVSFDLVRCALEADKKYVRWLGDLDRSK